jgi:hypothetical protein
VLDDLHAVVTGEALARRVEHDLGEVEAHAERLGAIRQEQGEQPAVARAEVEDATGVTRNEVEEDALPLGTARKLVRPVEIVINVLGAGPLLARHGAYSRFQPK